MPRSAGYTLWELLYTLALAGVIVGLGAPSLSRFVLESRLSADVNGLVTAIQLARSEAAKRGRPVVLCKTRDRWTCGGVELEYGAGWMVFVNVDGRRPPERSATEPLLYAHEPRVTGPITSNRAAFEFRPFHRRSTNGTVTFCDRRGETAARAVIVSYTGRPRVSGRGPGNRRLRCADLP